MPWTLTVLLGVAVCRMKVNSLADGVLGRIQVLGSAGTMRSQVMSHFSSILVG